MSDAVTQVREAAQPWFGDDTEAWMDRPNIALGERTPREVALAEGPGEVLRVIHLLESGGYP